MAYGKGKNKDLIKRVVELGPLPTSRELSELRSRILIALGTMAASVWPRDIVEPIPQGKDIDAVMLRVQSELSQSGLNNVWGEKARLLAKTAVLEQWKRAQRNLFGRFKNIGTIGDTPMADGTNRLVNLPEVFSHTLTTEDIEQLNGLAADRDFSATLQLFCDLSSSDCGLSAVQADALRAMASSVRSRFRCPVWNQDAVIQVHLDYRCVRGGKAALSASLDTFGACVMRQTSAEVDLHLTSTSPRGESMTTPMRLAREVVQTVFRHQSDDVRAASLIIELGLERVRPMMVVLRPPNAPSAAECRTVVAEDFGFTNTSSIVVLRSRTRIGEERLPGSAAITAATKRRLRRRRRGSFEGSYLRRR